MLAGIGGVLRGGGADIRGQEAGRRCFFSFIFLTRFFFSAVQFGKLLFRVTKCLDGCLVEDEMKWSGMSLYRCTEYFISIQNEAMW
jgi:hypothetical protein